MFRPKPYLTTFLPVKTDPATQPNPHALEYPHFLIFFDTKALMGRLKFGRDARECFLRGGR